MVETPLIRHGFAVPPSPLWGEGSRPTQIGWNCSHCWTFEYIYWELGRSAPVGGRRPQGPPLRRKWTGSVDWAKPGAAVEMHHLKFYAKPGPSGPEEIAECHSDFARRKGCTMFKG